MKKERIKRIDFEKLRDLNATTFSNFSRYLTTLPRELMNSLSTGLGAGQTALTLAGAGATTIVTTTGALTVLGSVIMGVVGGVIGAVAITLGVLAMARQFNDHKKRISAVLEKSETLKEQLALVAFNAETLTEAELSEFVSSLNPLEGETLTQKLCNLYATTPDDLEEKVLATLTTMGKKNTNASLSRGLAQLQLAYKTQSQAVRADILSLLNRLKIGTFQSKDPAERQALQAVIQTLTLQPGTHLKEKIASAFGIDSADGLDVASPNSVFNPVGKLEESIRAEIELQYFDLLATYNPKGKNEALTRFNKNLSLIAGDNYDAKIRNLLQAKPEQLTSTVFKERATTHPTATLKKLIANKAIIDNQKSTQFDNNLGHAEDFFAGFLGGMTGFGIVVGIAAVVGISIATSGIGLIILIAAAAAAAIGFGVALWVRNQSKNNNLKFNKHVDDTESFLSRSTESAKSLNNRAELKAQTTLLAEATEGLAGLENTHRATTQALEEANRRLAELENSHRATVQALEDANIRIAEADRIIGAKQSGSPAPLPAERVAPQESNAPSRAPASPQPTDPDGTAHAAHNHTLSDYVSKRGLVHQNTTHEINDDSSEESLLALVGADEDDEEGEGQSINHHID